MIKLVSSQGFKDDSTHKSLNITQQAEPRQKSHDCLNKQRKKLDKIQHPFMIKALEKLPIEKSYLNIKKAIYDTPIVNKHCNEWGNTEVSSSKF
jgi:hypothetical protein